MSAKQNIYTNSYISQLRKNRPPTWTCTLLEELRLPGNRKENPSGQTRHLGGGGFALSHQYPSGTFGVVSFLFFLSLSSSSFFLLFVPPFLSLTPFFLCSLFSFFFFLPGSRGCLLTGAEWLHVSGYPGQNNSEAHLFSLPN